MILNSNNTKMYFVYLTKKTCAQTTANPNGSRPKKRKNSNDSRQKTFKSIHCMTKIQWCHRRRENPIQRGFACNMLLLLRWPIQSHTHTHNKTFHHKKSARRLKSLCIGSANEQLKSAWFIYVTEWTVISFSIVRIFSRILIENKQFFFCFIKFNVLARDWGNHICLNLAHNGSAIA